MIKRKLSSKVQNLAKQYPVVTITGPRQSGKTTLAKMAFSKYSIYSLEDPDLRQFAMNDPRGFLGQKKKMVIDEIQRVPELLSYIQGIVDSSNLPGQFILTGSHQFKLASVVNQSLAGRTALVSLLPFSMKELNEDLSYEELIYRGFYPRVVDQKLDPTEASAFYVNTYLEKDLREIKDIKNLSRFESFLRLCAANVGQLLNKERLSNDIGVDAKTIDSWLSILQASYVLFLLPPHFENFRKRVTKSAKLYFYDTGLASYLLGIKKANHLKAHPLKGQLFENLLVIEKLKAQLNAVEKPSLYFYRDNSGNEVDLLEDLGLEIKSYEIKSTATLSSSLFKGLNFYKKLNPKNKKSYLIYTGEEQVVREGHHCTPYKKT